ncbi:hypothetical protein BOX37_03955 [Nocardia mangyaensis]|uniref:Uncharacterized protein n=1 Tax=Nocardia mangyaensis TaxID=2213200 RepID=A0A1J0VML6_9NOCA|nr:hypothetical protein [Nocardia mangyaensis]APE33258.1 hypothetical protein BOX37_03955 [Nocardia mangyaensis]
MGGDNPWEGLAGQARSGSLTLEDGAIGDAVTAAAESAYAIEFLRDYVVLLRDSYGMPKDTLHSASELRDKYLDLADDLDDRLGKHLDILAALADTLMTADKSYQSTEDNSEAEFTRLKGEAKDRSSIALTDHQEIPPGFGDAKEFPGLDEVDRFAELAALAATEEGVQAPSIAIEPASSLDLSTFQKIYDEMAAIHLTWKGERWTKIAEGIEGAFADLRNELSRLKREELWKGAGANDAESATEAYRQQAGALVTAMQRTGDNMTMTSGWARELQTGLRTALDNEYLSPALLRSGGSFVEDGTDQLTWNLLNNDPARRAYMETPGESDYHLKMAMAAHNAVNAARSAFGSWYEPGMEATDASIPILPDPKIRPGDNGGDNGGGGGGGGGGGVDASAFSGGGGGGGGGLSDGFLNAMNTADQARFGTDALTGLSTGGMRNGAGFDTEEWARQAAAQRELAEREAARQAAQQAAQDAVGQLQTAAQDGLSAAQDALSSAENMAGIPGAIPTGLAADKNMPSKLADALKAAGAKGGGLGGGGGGGGGPQAALARDASQASKLFPRAAISADGMATGRAGLGPMAGMPGAPGPMGGGGAGAGQGQGQNKDHKRADYLDSTEHLDEAIGEAPVVVRPVVEG